MSLRELDKTGVKIPSIGLGCMVCSLVSILYLLIIWVNINLISFLWKGMSAYYGSFDEQENIKLLNRSIELGCTFWDTAVRI